MKSYSHHHMDSHICWLDKSWRFTCLYGYPETNRKLLTWELIKNLASKGDRPWLLGGDMNKILYDTEKTGGP